MENDSHLSHHRAASFDLLDPELCLELLTSTTVGRVAFAGAEGLVLLPVNYRVLGGGVYLRTSTTGTLSELADHAGEVLFEVDYHAPSARDGWSVLVRGTCTRVTDPDLLARPELARLVPWATGSTGLVLAIAIVLVTGRRVSAHVDHARY